MNKQEITKKKSGGDWIYLDSKGEEIGIAKENIEWIISLKLEPLRDFLEMLSTADIEIDRAAFIAQALLERAEEQIYEAIKCINENYGTVEIVKAMHQQSVEPGTILDVVFTPAENGKKAEVTT